jgi:hypothetical protein
MDTESHSTAIALSEPAPAEITAGSEVEVKVAVTCSAGCDLCGLPLTVHGPGDDESECTLATSESGKNESAEITLTAPQKVGPQTWRIAFEPHEADGVRHDGCSLVLTINTIPHGTSLAVWDIPSPVLKGQPFTIKVGAKSAANSDLKGLDIAVHDADGAVAARGRLRDTPLPGTAALYWDEVELTAPADEGLSKWSVRFAADGLALPHDGTAAEFSAMVSRPPEHRLTVKVIEQKSKAPIADVQVRLGPFRGMTDPAGIAEVMMPKGTYDLHVWKSAYEAPAHSIEIKDDLSVEVEALFVPEEDPDNAWTM